MPPLLAAVDLGSNSFHLLVAEHCAGGYRPRLYRAEKVQLALGQTAGRLADGAVRRALACLRRFAVPLRELEPAWIRAVGTEALRVSANRAVLLEPAREILGVPVEVISGDEEARLVYAVAANPAVGDQLVVDVGGGSTELVLGRGPLCRRGVSVPVGCVGLLDEFPGARLHARAYASARARARQALGESWGGGAVPSDVIGCSGTLLAVEAVLASMHPGSRGIARDALPDLRARLLRFEALEAVCFPGLCESRRSVFAPGLALVEGLFDALSLEHISVSPMQLREGVLADLAARHCEWAQLHGPAAPRLLSSGP